MPIDDGEHEPALSRPDETTEAITLLYRREGGAVYRTIYAIVLDAGEARDLTREAFVRAYRAWDRSGVSDPRIRLLRIAADLAITHERGGRNRRGTARWTPAEAVGVDDQANEPQESDLVVWLMRPLTPEQRALVSLCCFQNIPPAQVADQLGTSAGIVASRLNRAMQVLRARAQAAGAMQQLEYAAP